jgi:hypothetical protein
LGMERRPGRPKGLAYPVIKQLRLRQDDADDLKALSERWRCSEAEAMRRAIREAAKREGVEPPPPDPAAARGVR